MRRQSPPEITLCNECNILVVDDDDSNRLLLRKFLERDGHTVIEAANGVQGLKVFDALSPDIVFTDIVMPVMEGLSFVRELRNKDQRTPVIVMTSDIHGRAKEFFELSSQLGATYALEKPITKEKLEEALNQAIEHINK